MFNSLKGPAIRHQYLNIIVVEDDIELRDIFVAGLQLHGHRVRGVGDGKALDNALLESPADIVLLDLGLPGEDGIAIAQRLRNLNSCGIVVITARGQVYERVRGLDAGADLYYVKPVDIRELDAAIRSLARRISGTVNRCWRFDQKSSKLYTPSGTEVFLSAQECILMGKMLEKPGMNVSRSDIFATLKQPDDIYADKRLETMISRLRSKVRSADPESALPIRARHNIGYAFLEEIRSV